MINNNMWLNYYTFGKKECWKEGKKEEKGGGGKEVQGGQKTVLDPIWGFGALEVTIPEHI